MSTVGTQERRRHTVAAAVTSSTGINSAFVPSQVAARMIGVSQAMRWAAPRHEPGVEAGELLVRGDVLADAQQRPHAPTPIATSRVSGSPAPGVSCPSAASTISIRP